MIGATANPEDELQAWARHLVRAGFVTGDALLSEVTGAVASELPGIDASILARAWIGGAQAELRRDAAGWPTPSDHDRLQAAFDECQQHGVVVAQAVGQERDAQAVLSGLAEPPRGLVWFDRDAVGRAIDTGVLDLTVWSPTGEPVGGDAWLTGAVLGCLDRHGLRARYTGGVQVATRWQRRP